jgi:hypothetical protein
VSISLKIPKLMQQFKHVYTHCVFGVDPDHCYFFYLCATLIVCFKCYGHGVHGELCDELQPRSGVLTRDFYPGNSFF